MLEALKVCFQLLDPTIAPPEYAYTGDAGLDLRSACDCTLQPGARASIPTAIKVAIPQGYAGFVLPRSGLAAKQGLSLVNAPGLIDSQYRGEVTVVAINLDQHTPIEIKKGDRIAQLVILACPHINLERTDELDTTARNEKGFGSSGTV